MLWKGLIPIFAGILFDLISIPIRWLMGEATYAILNAILP